MSHKQKYANEHPSSPLWATTSTQRASVSLMKPMQLPSEPTQSHHILSNEPQHFLKSHHMHPLANTSSKWAATSIPSATIPSHELSHPQMGHLVRTISYPAPSTTWFTASQSRPAQSPIFKPLLPPNELQSPHPPPKKTVWAASQGTTKKIILQQMICSPVSSSLGSPAKTISQVAFQDRIVGGQEAEPRK